MDLGIEKFPMKVMTAASDHILRALESEAAELANECERDSRLVCRAAGYRMSDYLVLHLLTALEFGYCENAFHLVNLPSEVERLRVGETVH